MSAPVTFDLLLELWDIAESAELAYRIGGMPAAGVVQAGRVVHWSA